MITPEQIRAKAKALYGRVIDAWLEGRDFFPYVLPANLKPAPTYLEAKDEQHALREGSKQKLGYGYSLEVRAINTRRHSTQELAVAVSFETRDDLLKLIGKWQEFRRLTRLVELVRARQPQLEPWIRKHWSKLLAVEDSLSQLLDVVEYLKAHPRPNCFMRELPLAVSTKLAEEHSRLLGQWLDILMPEAVDVTYGFDQFALRYGFRAPDDQLLFRILDLSMLAELQCPGTEIALPLTTLAALPVREAKVIIVENKINLLTLPSMPRTVALGGFGNAVSRLFRIPWIESLPLVYWGDIDIEGLEILARVRSRWPHVESLMMDGRTLEQHRHLCIPGNEHSPELPPPDALTAEEQAAFLACRDHHLRLEQERIPPDVVKDRLTSATSALSASPR